MSVIGRWAIQSSLDFDDSYLHMDGPAYVTFQPTGRGVDGEFHVGLQTGILDGREKPDGSVSFTFEGNDEMDEMRGAGTAVIEDSRLILTLTYHQGDEYSFECARIE